MGIYCLWDLLFSHKPIASYFLVIWYTKLPGIKMIVMSATVLHFLKVNGPGGTYNTPSYHIDCEPRLVGVRSSQCLPRWSSVLLTPDRKWGTVHAVLIMKGRYFCLYCCILMQFVCIATRMWRLTYIQKRYFCFVHTHTPFSFWVRIVIHKGYTCLPRQPSAREMQVINVYRDGQVKIDVGSNIEMTYDRMLPTKRQS